MDKETLVKRAQLDLLYELRRICRKHDISYFLTGGTLIGAIRHQGFIPWDDDIDVGMLWENYARFIEACKEDLDPAYTLYDWDKDPNSPLPFAKLKIKGTHYREAISANSDMNDEIYIDIFPYDNAPDSRFLRKVQAAQVYIIRKILMLRCGFDLAGDSKLRKLLYGILKFVSRIRSTKGWRKSLLRVQRRYNHGTTEVAANMCGAYSYERESKPRRILENVTDHIFENGMFSIPVEYDAFLRSCYGDYMQLPPEDQRAGKHEILTIDFGNYTIRHDRDPKGEM